MVWMKEDGAGLLYPLSYYLVRVGIIGQIIIDKSKSLFDNKCIKNDTNEAIMDYIVRDNLLELEEKAKELSDDIVDRLVYYRKELNLTQQDIADATGIKRANIARIESKKHAISLESLVKYAACLNLEISLNLQQKQ